MTAEVLEEVQQKIGYAFKNPALLRQAFVAPSVTDATQNRVQHYQMLEFIGDAVLGAAVVKNLVAEHCALDEGGQLVSRATVGHLSAQKARLVRNERLAVSSAALDFDAHLERAHGHLSYDHKNKKGDLIESVLGAVALDSGWNMEIVARVADTMLSEVAEKVRFCEQLRSYCEQKMLSAPAFSFWQHGSGRYDCAVSLSVTDAAFMGSGKSVEDAEESAAEVAYRYLSGANGTHKPPAKKSKPTQPTAVEVLNKKYTAKEITQPLYDFAFVKDGKRMLWVCTLSLADGGQTVSAKATVRKKAKQLAAEAMLTVLEQADTTGTVRPGECGRGLLWRAMQLRGA